MKAPIPKPIPMMRKDEEVKDESESDEDGTPNKPQSIELMLDGGINATRTIDLRDDKSLDL